MKKGQKGYAKGTAVFDKTPFDLAKNADVILRASDGEEFFTNKALLSLASPVFETMFTLPQSTAARDIPMVDVAEKKKTLHRLLLWCDPRCTPSWELEDVLEVLATADKYQMTGVIANVGKLLTLLNHHIEAQPIRLYALGIRHGLTEMAKMAAKETLYLAQEGRPEMPELDAISGTAIQRLQNYHLECSRVAKQAALERSDVLSLSLSHTSPISSECGCPTMTRQQEKLPMWWIKYMELATGELYRRPRGRILTDMDPNFKKEMSTFISEYVRECCSNTSSSQLSRFSKELADEVEKRVEQVKLVLGAKDKGGYLHENDTVVN